MSDKRQDANNGGRVKPKRKENKSNISTSTKTLKAHSLGTSIYENSIINLSKMEQIERMKKDLLNNDDNKEIKDIIL